jgi:hypothetical protein
VENRRAVLSSASTTLEELVARMAEAGEEANAEGDESLAHDLFEVERTLRMAHRRLDGVNRRLR